MPNNIENKLSIIDSIFAMASKTKYDYKNDDMIKKIKIAIKNLFILEISELGLTEEDVSLIIINDDSIHYRGYCHADIVEDKINGQHLANAHIIINLEYFLDGLSINDINERQISVKSLFQTLFHELEHLKQFMLITTNASSKENLIFAKEIILSDDPEIRKKIPQYYDNNYDSFSIEADANIAASREYSKITKRDNLTTTKSIDVLENSKENSYHHSNISFGEDITMEKSDMLTHIIDYLICDLKQTDLLKRYHILQKEYNLDGTKKSIFELIDNLFEERQTIINNQELTKEDKQELLLDTNEMYYEIIYRQLIKTNLNDLADSYDTIELTSLLTEMSNYFIKEQKRKEQLSQTLIKEVIISSKTELPINEGYIEVTKDNQQVNVPIKEYLSSITPDNHCKKYIIGYNDQGPITVDLEEFLNLSFVSKYLPSSGIVILKNGKSITVQELLEKYILRNSDYRNGLASMRKYLQGIMMTEDVAAHFRTLKRLSAYYQPKIKFLEASKLYILSHQEKNSSMYGCLPISIGQIAKKK